MVAAIILAAGLSRRLGQPKLLLPLGGKSLIRFTLEQIITAGEGRWEEVLVVLGHEAVKIGRELEGMPIKTVFNPQYEKGISASLIAGLRAIGPQAEGAMIFLGDQPLVSTEVIRSMLRIFRRDPRPIMAPVYERVRGNPVLFSRSLFPELMTVEGDKGGSEVIMREPGRVTHVAFTSSLEARDLDTWEDYEALQAMVCPDKITAEIQQ